MGRDHAALERLRQLIHNKIRERTPMNMAEETWLWRHLRKKDIHDTGELNKDQFVVSMLGVAVGAFVGASDGMVVGTLVGAVVGKSIQCRSFHATE